MNKVAILYPVFVQVFLTFCVLISMAFARGRAIKTMDRQRGNPDLAMGRNQLELPVLFYVAVAFAMIIHGADLVMVVLAWLFVLSRVIHAAIHVGPNKVRWRTPAFAFGCLTLMIMWAKLALQVATVGLA